MWLVGMVKRAFTGSLPNLELPLDLAKGSSGEEKTFSLDLTYD